MKKTVIGYFADGPWSHESIHKLLADDSIKISFICARADGPDEKLREIAIKNRLTFFFPTKVNSEEFMNEIKDFECDLFVSMSYNQIFKSNILKLPRIGVINCHAGKLPFYRGRNVLNWALINGEREFGITTHFIDEGIDSGDIILQRTYTINQEDDYSTILSRAYEECPKILYDTIKLVQGGSYSVTKQSDIDQLGFYCVKRQAGDEIIDWDQSSFDLFNFVRALCIPGPSAKTFFNGEAIWINRVELVPGARNFKGIAGSIVAIEEKSFLVKTRDSFVRVLEWSTSYQPRIGHRLK